MVLIATWTTIGEGDQGPFPQSGIILSDISDTVGRNFLLCISCVGAVHTPVFDLNPGPSRIVYFDGEWYEIAGDTLSRRP